MCSVRCVSWAYWQLTAGLSVQSDFRNQCQDAQHILYRTGSAAPAPCNVAFSNSAQLPVLPCGQATFQGTGGIWMDVKRGTGKARATYSLLFHKDQSLVSSVVLFSSPFLLLFPWFSSKLMPEREHRCQEAAAFKEITKAPSSIK